MEKTITVLAGDGIGAEVTGEALKVLASIASCYNHQFHYVHHLIGAGAIDATGSPLPDNTLQSCIHSDAILLGAIGDPRYDNDPAATVRPEQGLLALRKSLELYANIRPVQLYPELAALSPLKKEKLAAVDMLIVRELTGGIYFGKKEKTGDGSFASDLCHYTRQEIERVAIVAFEAAMGRRRKLTLVDKANVLETSRLWRQVVREMAIQFPEVTVDYLFVDNAAMQLILNPQQFDVILTENMFGDIISDEASVLNGSLGLLPSSSLGKGTALFEPVHGSYPQAKGKNIANPMAAILSAAMMLDYFGLAAEAALVRQAVHKAITRGKVTSDLDPATHYSTAEVGAAICHYIEQARGAGALLKNTELGQSTII